MSETLNSAAGVQKQVKSGPPQFLVNATDATNAGEYNKAIEFLKQGIGQDSYAAYKGIGDILVFRGENQKALEWLEKARQCKPESISVVESIGQALASLGKKEEAIEEFRAAIEQQNDAKKINALLEAMRLTGLADGAIEIMEKMIEANPQRLDLPFELAWFFKKIGELKKAEALYKKIAKLSSNPAIDNQLGLIYHQMGRLSEAIEYMQNLTKKKPDFAGGWNNLALMLMESGRVQESIEVSRAVVARCPSNWSLHSNLLSGLIYLQDMDEQAIFEEHKKWGQKHTPISMARTNHSNPAKPDRKIRIGYISPDFRKHVVALRVKELLESHNQNDNLEIYGYGNVEVTDQVTAEIQKKFDQYRNIWGAGHETVAKIIEQDKIDILVDLAGHTKNNRLLVMAYKPAPVQITFMGYGNTTGMEAIDYIITDRVLTPPEMQQYYTEEFAYLPGHCCCYTPNAESPEISTKPANGGGKISFGAFGVTLRFNSPLLKVWAQILKESPASKLILGFKNAGDQALREYFLLQFEQHGVARDRIDIRGILPYEEYLKQYNEVDILLDTFPENGGTTICDAIWMGVPVISLASRQQAGRYGLSLLSCMGLERFAAGSVSEYVSKAVALANNPESLTELSRSLRQRMAESQLCDVGQFAHNIESAYREMWRRWCRDRHEEVMR